jgi:hypothetical protein
MGSVRSRGLLRGLPGSENGGQAHPLAEVEGVSATTRHRWVATLRGGALLVALATVMIVLTAAASLALSAH